MPTNVSPSKGSGTLVTNAGITLLSDSKLVGLVSSGNLLLSTDPSGTSGIIYQDPTGLTNGVFVPLNVPFKAGVSIYSPIGQAFLVFN